MENGTSLLESLIILVVLSILASTAMPAASSWLERSRLESVTHQIRQDIGFARAQAVTQQREVLIQPASANCWACGWQVGYVESIGSSTTSELTNTQVLIKRAALDSRLRVTSNQPWRAGATFLPSGEAVQPNRAFAAGTFTVCSANHDVSYKIIINKAGRARILRQHAGCL
ncbi:hypothetical protein D8779_03935 [Pseudomonas leptonychotis]|uniref:Type II secretion system protein H n=2 Tax=Pseudomonas leptonychotis TaxID=2448482 RepID=A0A4T2A453_9PSED|nr:hypothetical protein D8779_03935 [Pseudomonas leptonychotis]